MNEQANDGANRRTGVLTFHKCINYGSYWQARCLVEGLRARGHDAVLLDHHSRRIEIAEWRCAFRPTRPTPVPASDYPFYRRKMRKFFRAFADLPCSPRFPLDSPDTMPPFDLVVVGSDEVWNLAHPWYGGCPLFYGQGVRTARLASYAASFGNQAASAGLQPWWVEMLQKFEHISVRDENARAIIENALGVRPPLVLDPCLQFPPKPDSKWRGLPFPYVAVYGHNFSPHFGREVQRWARARGLRTVSVGYRNDWADSQWLSAGPDDFAHGLAHAHAVATNFFHGCVFALNHAKPFVCETSFYRTTKIQGLMETVGAENHLVTSDTPVAVYDALLDCPLEAHVCERIHALRDLSETYVQKVLA